MAEQDPATSTVRPNVWVLFVLQFLASETAMIGRQYQISPECNSNLWSLNQNEIFTFHFLSDRDMGNCNVGWSIRSHPSLYELSRSFFQSIGIGIENFGLGVKVKTSVTSYSPDLLVGDEIISSKTGGKMTGRPGQTRPLTWTNMALIWEKICKLIFFQIPFGIWWHWVSRGHYLLVLGGTGSVLGGTD